MKSRPGGSPADARSLALTADLGNSRLKLRIWRLGDDVRTARAHFGSVLAVVDGFAEAAREFACAHTDVRAAALSSVAAPERERALAAALAASLRGPLLTAPDCGLVLDVLEAETVGRDRLYAARGALELGAADAVVLDAGTALTVDAVRAGRGGSPGTFLGGAIAPGPGLLARALAEHTARLPLVDPAPGAAALGRDTASAVRAGVVVGFRGAARELASRVASEAGLRAPLVVVTGGAAGLLLEPPLFGEDAPPGAAPRLGGVLHDPELVHRGLLAALRAALP
jgi:type III pantothenate kinase